MYKSIIRPILFRMNPEKAHDLVLKGLRIMRRIPGAGAVMRMLYKKKPAPQLARRVFGIDFPHPVGLAAGLDKNATCYNELSWCGFSFIEVGSFTPEAQPGNPAPRLFRLPADQALINRMGLGNEGVDKAVERIGKDRPEVLLAGSIAKNTGSESEEEIRRDYLRCFSTLYDFVDFLTVNVSCPNVEGLQRLQGAGYLPALVDPLLEMRMGCDTYKPLLIKVSPDIEKEELDGLIHYCRLSGVDGLIVGNTTRSREGLKTPAETLEKIGKGGLSGAPLFEKNLALVRYIHEKTQGGLPIIGVGGINTPQRAQRMLDAGASLIEIYTGFIYEGPAFVHKILKHLNATSEGGKKQ